MSKVYPAHGLSFSQAEEIIKQELGDVKLSTKYYPSDDLMLWFVGEPDKYFQNYVAEMGAANLVIG